MAGRDALIARFKPFGIMADLINYWNECRSETIANATTRTSRADNILVAGAWECPQGILIGRDTLSISESLHLEVVGRWDCLERPLWVKSGHSTPVNPRSALRQ